MTAELEEKIKTEVWYTFFTEYLYKNEIITEEQKEIMERLISK